MKNKILHLVVFVFSSLSISGCYFIGDIRTELYQNRKRKLREFNTKQIESTTSSLSQQFKHVLYFYSRDPEFSVDSSLSHYWIHGNDNLKNVKTLTENKQGKLKNVSMDTLAFASRMVEFIEMSRIDTVTTSPNSRMFKSGPRYFIVEYYNSRDKKISYLLYYYDYINTPGSISDTQYLPETEELIKKRLAHPKIRLGELVLENLKTIANNGYKK